MTALNLWGPPSTRLAGGLLLGAYAQEIHLFEAIGTPAIPVAGFDLNHPVGQAGIFRVMEDAHVVVDLATVSHGPEVPYAFAYRFTLKNNGKRIVFSGDTTAPNPNLIALAQGADILVHEVMDTDAIETMIIPRCCRPLNRTACASTCSTPIPAPLVAQAAGVPTLVLTHYVPAAVPISTYLAKAQAAAAAIGYQGTIVAPTDLDSVPI